MNTKDIDGNIGMPDIDKQWKRFENEVIHKNTPTTKRAKYVASCDGLVKEQ